MNKLSISPGSPFIIYLTKTHEIILNTFVIPLVVQVTLAIGITDQIKWVNVWLCHIWWGVGIFHLKCVFQ